jgi:excisionase family DNA binding protein
MPVPVKETKMNETKTPKWLTMAEYADLMGISESKVKRMKLAHQLPYVQEGLTVRIPREATDYLWLTKWREEHS